MGLHSTQYNECMHNDVLCMLKACNAPDRQCMRTRVVFTFIFYEYSTSTSTLFLIIVINLLTVTSKSIVQIVNCKNRCIFSSPHLKRRCHAGRCGLDVSFIELDYPSVPDNHVLYKRHSADKKYLAPSKIGSRDGKEMKKIKWTSSHSFAMLGSSHATIGRCLRMTCCRHNWRRGAVAATEDVLWRDGRTAWTDLVISTGHCPAKDADGRSVSFGQNDSLSFARGQW